MSTEIVTACIAIGGLVLSAALTLFWNFRNAVAARKLPFLQKQLEYGFEASQIVATLATTPDERVWATAHDRFWQLYYGTLTIFEDREVAICMCACGELIPIDGPVRPVQDPQLQSASLKLNQAIRRLLRDAWAIRSLEPPLDRLAK